jgi:hypothetical protein
MIEVKPDGTRVYWDNRDWSYLLDDLAVNHLNTPGRIYVEMNNQLQKDGTTTRDFDLLEWFVSKGAGVQFERATITFENVAGGQPLRPPASTHHSVATLTGEQDGG